jgi:hypothetical protein
MMGGMEVGRCGIIHRSIPKSVSAYPKVELHTVSAMASNPDLAVGEEC